MINNKYIKNFTELTESLNMSDVNNSEIDKFNNLSLNNKRKYLVDNFSVDIIEAMEICDDDTTVDDLPEEIKSYFY